MTNTTGPLLWKPFTSTVKNGCFLNLKKLVGPNYNYFQFIFLQRNLLNVFKENCFRGILMKSLTNMWRHKGVRSKKWHFDWKMEITCPSCKVSSVRSHVYLSRTECQYCGAHFDVSALRNVRMNRRLMSASLPALNQTFPGQQQPLMQQQQQQQPPVLYVQIQFSCHRVLILIKSVEFKLLRNYVK